MAVTLIGDIHIPPPESGRSPSRTHRAQSQPVPHPEAKQLQADSPSRPLLHRDLSHSYRGASKRTHVSTNEREVSLCGCPPQDTHLRAHLEHLGVRDTCPPLRQPQRKGPSEPSTSKPEAHSPSQGNGSALRPALLMPGSVTRAAGCGLCVCGREMQRPLQPGKSLHPGDC